MRTTKQVRNRRKKRNPSKRPIQNPFSSLIDQLLDGLSQAASEFLDQIMNPILDQIHDPQEPPQRRAPPRPSPSPRARLRTFYDVLEVSPQASPETITAAYRSLSKRFHPDVRSGGDEAKMKEIALAYGVLKDESKRREYDRQIGVR